MDTISNIVLSVLFGGIAVWLFYGYFKTKDLVIKDKRWNASRVLFAVAGVLCILSGFVYSSVLDWIRLICMMLAVVAFLLLRDGLNETGVCSMGSLTTYKEVKHYDYQMFPKKFKLYITAVDSKGGDYNVTLNFDPKDSNRVISYMKEQCGKKYTRMKKG